jgi:mannose-6-phosphate isomerase-like protein (cupin superfamily)
LGYVLKGRMLVKYADGEEPLRVGDLFYLPPGHAVAVEEDVEYVELSPPTAHDNFVEAAKRNSTAGRAP